MCIHVYVYTVLILQAHVLILTLPPPLISLIFPFFPPLGHSTRKRLRDESSSKVCVACNERGGGGRGKRDSKGCCCCVV